MNQHPGVYVEYLPSGLLAIEAASTSVAAFVGPVKRGRLNTPVFVTSPSLFAQQFGVLDDGRGGIRDLGANPDTFGFAVNAFFNNGGSKAYIVPVGGGGGRAAIGALGVPDNPADGFYFTARSDGEWANDLEIKLRQTDPTDPSLGYILAFGLTVEGRFKVLEQFTDLHLDPNDGRYLPSRVSAQSQLVSVAQSAIAGAGAGQTAALLSAPLAALDPTSIAAASTLLVVVSGAGAVTVTFDGSATSLEDLAAAIQTQVRAGATAGTPRAGFLAQVTRDKRLLLIAGAPFTGTSAVTATAGTARTALGLDPTVLEGADLASTTIVGADINGLTLTVVSGAATRVVPFTNTTTSLAAAAGLITAAFARAPGGAPESGAALPTLAATVSGTRLVMSVSDGAPSRAISITAAAGDARAILGLTTPNTSRRSSVLSYPAAFDTTTRTASSSLMGGVDPGAPSNTDYAAAFEVLRDFRDVSILLLPDKSWVKGGDNGAIDAAITHAEYMGNRMVIVDPPNPRVSDELTSPKAFLDLGAPNSSFTALYYPWLTVANPFHDPDTAANKPKTFALPPSAYAAGLWARIDGTRGVWKAPAGLEATVRGAQGPNVVIGNEYQDNLNEWGVNCIRSIQGPAVLWGARTLAAKAKPEFRYVPVRRTESMIGESLYRALQAVVFEPNDHKLWSSLRASATDFMDGLFRSGAFQGEKASQAYFVRCGLGATMTQGDIDAGIVRLVVGFAPLKPAEFVIVQIQQIVGRTA